jgi:hypothetical protein
MPKNDEGGVRFHDRHHQGMHFNMIKMDHIDLLLQMILNASADKNDAK